jgi:competence protein ComEA
MEKLQNWWADLHYSQAQKRALAILSAVAVFISVIVVSRGSSEEIIAAPTLEIQAPASTVMVDVSGAVTNPGVYSLPSGSRVVQAIEAAGGLAQNADTSDINQARIVKDGEQIYVFEISKYTGSSGKPRAAVRKNGPVMINRATTKEFESLDGIGPVLASRIVAFRKVNGPFMAIEDLLKVPGIGPNTFAKFKEKLRV